MQTTHATKATTLDVVIQHEPNDTITVVILLDNQVQLKVDGLSPEYGRAQSGLSFQGKH